MATCDRMIPYSNSWSKWKVKCTKPAVGVDTNGRALCVKCLNKFNKKYKKTSKMSKASAIFERLMSGQNFSVHQQIKFGEWRDQVENITGKFDLYPDEYPEWLFHAYMDDCTPRQAVDAIQKYEGDED